MVTETLIEQGELPDPSDFKGIGNEFIANTCGLEKEIFIECDRCDESFMDDEDFTTHKDITHGDKVESNEEAEDEYLASMDPDASKEELKEARKIVHEQFADEIAKMKKKSPRGYVKLKVYQDKIQPHVDKLIMQGAAEPATPGINTPSTAVKRVTQELTT